MGGVALSAGAVGCFASSSVLFSRVGGKKVSSLAANLTAPLISPSSSLAAISLELSLFPELAGFCETGEGKVYSPLLKAFICYCMVLPSEALTFLPARVGSKRP